MVRDRSFRAYSRIALLSAANYAHLSLGHIKDKLDSHIPQSGPILVLVASVVEMSVAADTYVNDSTNEHPARVKWAVACGSISTFLCILQLLFTFARLHFSDISGKCLGGFLVRFLFFGITQRFFFGLQEQVLTPVQKV